MKPRLRFLLFGPVLCASLIATLPQITQAAVFERDWKTPGDGLLTYDDVNQREWLDLSETLLEQFAGAGPGTTRAEDLEARYQNVVGELEPGGMFDGFTVGKREGVVALAQSAGIDTFIRNFDTNAVATLQLIDFLSPTLSRSHGRTESRGYLAEFGTPRFPDRLEAILNYAPPRPADSGNARLLFLPNDDLRSPMTAGVMLLRNVVPEPSVIVLVVIGVTCIRILSLVRGSAKVYPITVSLERNL